MGKLKVGDQVILKADHMPGMKGAKASIIAAKLSNVYQITYTPTNGDSQVTHHKWIIQEEIRKAPKENYLLPSGYEFTCLATHMPHMYLSKAIIENGRFDIAYQVVYEPVNGGGKLMQHKWFIDEEFDMPK
ncbi:YdhK family protein [Melissococcus plutonius]|uniref:DUF1541 domain-containing protein n=1 Tax=Melissococcus plutonius (strain ATCC 35311 / DSM 29964 / CIP 104052 / LMG 20360 / NCIMB 702443) TaxID=940190 RepID=F3YCQ3_MELPT|nr:YdhK family protein [Melissococcus plutonius]AIM26130.1 hypothetical protein MEPL_178p001000 [Melissococcus plutonius S1]KMT23602.1 hypothetical protein MEPL2_5c01260 [Melissococcus plutonius]KMT23655.1 hypothetical protein MEPL3_9c00510 [Melissococcus plutonius]KMT24289.1 hypothetical protein MEPL1_10c00410 [Melissococcus plutonius]KMT28115.1 hypothetical protein MEPL4_7c00730 [Melissococcus plutonius]